MAAAYSGANALALAAETNETKEFPPAAVSQSALFPAMDQKVIPFDQIARQAGNRSTMTLPPTAAPPAAAPRQASRKASPPVKQETLDFLPTVGSAQRMLKTDVPAQIYCERPVATPMHRFVAGAMDALILAGGFALFLVAAWLMGAPFGSGKALWLTLGASGVLISLFYGLIWMIARRETAGMEWSGLQIITFDGAAVDPVARFVRFVSSWLSFCSGGLGVIWALADEENLTWHDHISKTFPTFRETSGNFVRQHRR